MIRYLFSLADGERLDFAVDDRAGLAATGEPLPEWASLARHKCPRCPLDEARTPACPAAEALVPVVTAFGGRESTESSTLRVEQDQQDVQIDMAITARLPLQRAVRALAGLLLPLSGCPVLSRLRPMAHLHLPLASDAHTAFRFLGMYLIAQYLRHQGGAKPDWNLDGLLELLRSVRETNNHLAARLREAMEGDALINGLIILDASAQDVGWNIEESLDELRPLFAVYLGD